MVGIPASLDVHLTRAAREDEHGGTLPEQPEHVHAACGQRTEPL